MKPTPILQELKSLKEVMESLEPCDEHATRRIINHVLDWDNHRRRIAKEDELRRGCDTCRDPDGCHCGQ